jgi:hypothetical protein
MVAVVAVLVAEIEERVGFVTDIIPVYMPPPPLNTAAR